MIWLIDEKKDSSDIFAKKDPFSAVDKKETSNMFAKKDKDKDDKEEKKNDKPAKKIVKNELSDGMFIFTKVLNYTHNYIC
jgi:hypothetical protein